MRLAKRWPAHRNVQCVCVVTGYPHGPRPRPTGRDTPPRVVPWTLFSFELRGFSRSIPHSDTAPPSGCYLVCLVPCKDSIPHSKTSHTSSLPSRRPPQSTTLHMHASRVPVQKAQTERGHSPHCSLRGCEEPPPLLTLPGRAPGQMRADEAPHARFAIESPHGLL